jgi:hypothetical protein
MPASGGFVEVAPLAEAERSPELNPELYNGTNRMRLHVFANDARAQAVLSPSTTISARARRARRCRTST